MAGSSRWSAARCLVLLIGLASALSVHAMPEGFELGDASVGPTCAHYLGMGPMAWRQRGGDWVDAQGQPRGQRPFSTMVVARGQGRPFVEMDLSPLLRAWQAQPRLPHIVVLRAVGKSATGSDVIDFHSRESSDITARPLLKLTLRDGRRLRLAPAADTFLDCSSLSSLGRRAELKTGGDRSVLLRFELPKNLAEVESAALLLSSDKQYGASAQTIGSFALKPAFTEAHEPRQGLAAAAPADRGLEGHPDVLFTAGFEESAWMARFGELALRGDAESIDADKAGGFVPLAGRALRVTMRRGKNLGLDLRYRFARHGQAEPQELYFRYYLRFARDWNPSGDGGKLPGIAGTYGKAGWGMRKPDGFNGWSVRGGFARRPTDDPTVARLTGLVSYAYHVDQSDNSGAIYGWGEGLSGVLSNERWYCVEQYVKLNDPGQRNGIVRAWVDGSQVLEQGGLRFRDTDKLAIEEVWLDVYHGGVAPAPHDLTLYIDNIVVARRYIGPAVFKAAGAQ
ncbi:hypothetical protein PEC18_33835 [Paucibacter sp. O1-1]|nr:hypothetical protein [Paucibacter sp. O1-1]MDA3830675.1 hypothetical protein [Paucibacter sp. O1-1]